MKEAGFDEFRRVGLLHPFGGCTRAHVANEGQALVRGNRALAAGVLDLALAWSCISAEAGDLSLAGRRFSETSEVGIARVAQAGGAEIAELGPDIAFRGRADAGQLRGLEAQGLLHVGGGVYMQ